MSSFVGSCRNETVYIDKPPTESLTKSGNGFWFWFWLLGVDWKKCSIEWAVLENIKIRYI